MLTARHIDVLSATCQKVSSDTTHRAFWKHKGLPDEFECVWVKPSDGGATLALRPKVLRDQRAVRQCEHAVVAGQQAVVSQP